MIRRALLFYLLFHLLLFPFHLIPSLFLFSALSHREADHAGTGERDGLGVPCCRGMDRNKGLGGSAGRVGKGVAV